MSERLVEMETKGTHDGGGGGGGGVEEESPNFVALLREMTAEVMHEDDRPLLERTKEAVIQRGPRFRIAARSASEDIMQWMHRGGPWRAFLVSAVGIVIFVSLAALATFMLFFLTATANAIAIGFLMSVSGVGAFIAVFFMMLTAIYVGALLVAAAVISSIAFFTISAVIFVAGWIVFWWFIWQLVRKTVEVFRTVTGSALSAVSGGGATQIPAIEKQS